MTLLITMVTKAGIFMIADGLEVRNIGGGVIRAGEIEKLDRVTSLNVALSFWGTTGILSNNFSLIDELRRFENTLNEDDNVVTVSEKIKNYFEELAILNDDDNLGFHVCGYIGDETYVHHIHHVRGFESNHFRNEDSKREFQGRERFNEYPILFNGDNVIPNLFINLLTVFNDQIVFQEFHRRQAKRFLIYLMETAIKFQKFSFTSLNFGNLIGYPLRFCEITKDNIRLEINPERTHNLGS
ncbi:MAG: hypothetical protein ACXACX_02525 [Candidatus Hodarchaeales archaeon]|jgi:hypothetical protein